MERGTTNGLAIMDEAAKSATEKFSDFGLNIRKDDTPLLHPFDPHERARRRAKNKKARKSRKVNRGH